jgi:predicted DNA-binding transcriptional regulator YafY
MPPSTSRLLELLELLQNRPMVTGRELADRLRIDRRTVRRDIAALQEVGIPVEAARGAAGGYRLRPGYRLPPLMLSDEEATAVVLGLRAAGRLGVGDRVVVDRALAKIYRVLPDALRRRVQTLEAALAFTGRDPAADAPDPATSLVLADAIARGRRVRIGYRSHAGAATERELSPHGLVVHAGRWYLAAHDHGRQAMRTFRVDRISRAAVVEAAARPAEGVDTVAEVTLALARTPWRWEVEVWLDLPVERVRSRISGTLAELTADGEGTVLRMRAESLEWAASTLAGLGCALRVRQPEQLRAALRTLAVRLTDC